MLNSLVDSMSPIDTLIIAGWNCNTDPLDSESMYTLLTKLGANQAYIFGNEVNVDDEDVSALVEEKKLIESIGSLNQFLDTGLSGSTEYDFDEEFESFIRINKTAVEVPTSISRIVEQYGHIIHEQDFRPSVVDVRQLYNEFLFESARMPFWSAFPLELDFQRDFFPELKSLVLDQINNDKVAIAPVIVHGATCSGKSVMLCRLCYELYRLEKFVIVHIRKSMSGINFRVLDDVCEWAESSGGLTTVICWDGMSNVEIYENLSAYLSSRGRKQIVVGSCYKVNDNKGALYIEAKTTFTKTEGQRFETYLTDIAGLDVNNKRDYDSAFLATLYRYLPESRFNITTGVVSEVNFTRDILRNGVKLAPLNSETVMERAFSDAFSKTEALNFLGGEADDIGSEFDFHSVIDPVMVFGQFGIDMPFDLLVRLYPKLKVSNIGELFSQVDIIRWTENSYGDIFLAPRHALEATIYCERIIGSYKEHVALLIKIIEVVVQKKIKNCIEVDFCTEAIHCFGPNGGKGTDYRDSYLEISRAIGKLLSKQKIQSSRLMLQEAYLIREYGRKKFNKNIYYTEYFELLSDALEIVDKAISLEESNKNHTGRGVNYSLIILIGEKTSILGTLANQAANKGDVQATKLVHQALETAQESLKYNISNFRSLDSIAWIVLDHTKSKTEIDVDQITIILGALAVFNEYASSDFSKRYQSDFIKRKIELNSKINDVAITTELLAELKETNLEDYHYYKISKLIADVNINEPIQQNRDLQVIKDAIEYYYIHEDIPKDSYKLNVMKLRLFWMLKTEQPLLQGERIVVCKTTCFWEDVMSLTQLILRSAYNSNTILYEYLLAVSLFNIGRYGQCEELFKKIAVASESVGGSRRVFKSFLLANESGVRKFSGQVTNISTHVNKGEIYIDELATKVAIKPREFGLSREDNGRLLSDFHIAFNFIGPVVEKSHYFEGR